jgi:uncharacterized RDD family membrane protein YckC
MEIYIGQNSQKLGPFSLDEIQKGLEAGRFNTEDLAWYEGCEAWIPVTNLPGLKNAMPDLPLPEQPSHESVMPILELASRGRRLMAATVDGLAGMLLAIPGIILMILPLFAGGEDPDPKGILLIGLTMIVFTIAQAVLITKRGQSVGKIALGIRIARSQDGSNPGFLRGFLIRSLIPQFIYQVPLLGLLFLLADMGFIFSSERRCIHDLMADTVVVRG